MERYELIKDVGEGSFGRVIQAKKKDTGEMVAIKTIKRRFSSWNQCHREFKSDEVRSLAKMNHPNVIKLKELIFENGQMSLVLECNLYQIMEARQDQMSLPVFSESEIKHWCIQVFAGLAHIHQRGYFHRDLKPENLLVKQDMIKIGDLGMAREIESQPPYTARVGTLWYRAPEVLLGTGLYDSKVDMWAMGAIMAEMFMGQPLFPGTSELDQLNTISRFPAVNMIPDASAEAVSLINSLCSWEPRDRPTADQALHHPFFLPRRQAGCLCIGVPWRSFPNVVAAKGPPPGFESSCGSRPMPTGHWFASCLS